VGVDSVTVVAGLPVRTGHYSPNPDSTSRNRHVATPPAQDTAASSHLGRLIGCTRVSAVSQDLEVALPALTVGEMGAGGAGADDVMGCAPVEEEA
jgi:hypothetical protein